jgi:hypothetical protein
VNWNHGEPNDFAGAEDCVELMVYNGKYTEQRKKCKTIDSTFILIMFQLFLSSYPCW